MIPELLIMFGISGTKWCLNSLSQDTPMDEFGVFLDKNGNHRLYPSLKKVYYGHTKQGEYVLWYSKGGIAINVDKERSKFNEQEAIKNGHQFYLRTLNGRLGNEIIQGARYCKVGCPDKYYVKKSLIYDNEKTGEYYYGDFYMDMNFKLYSVTDETKEKDIKQYGKNNTHIQQEIIKLFNIESKNDIFKSLMTHSKNYTFKIKKYDNYTLVHSELYNNSNPVHNIKANMPF